MNRYTTVLALSFVLAACGAAQPPQATTPGSVELPSPLESGLPAGVADVQLSLSSAAGEEVVLAWIHGSHDGALSALGMEIPASGRDVGLFAIRSTVGGDERWIFDTPTLLAQVGVGSGGRPVATAGWATPRALQASSSADEEGNAARHRRAYELFSAHDPAMFELMSEDIVEHNASEAEDTVGRAALEQVNRGMWAGFSDIGVDVEGVFGADDWTACRGRLHGTQDGELPALGLSHTGRVIAVPFVEVVRWEGGLAKESYPFMDGLVLATQLGLVE